MATKLSRREFQRNVGALTLAGTGVASAGTPAAETERLPLPPLFYNNDGSFLFFPAPPRTPEDFVYEAVGRFVGTQISAVVCHMFGFGDAVPLFPTRVPEAQGIDRDSFLHVSEWKQQTCIRGLLDQGIDPWRLSLERAHEAGLQYWIGMRFNDLHGPRFQWPSHFRVAHREYELGNNCGTGVHGPESVYGEKCVGLNFAVPQVRAHRLELVEDACTRYDADGFEWDLLREPGHYFPDIERGRPVLTAYLREARALLDRIGADRGRPLGFGIRVPATLQKCHEIGLELKTWIHEGLVDYVSPGVHWDTATGMPYDEFVALAKGTSCKIYACTSEQVGPGYHRRPPAATLRAGAANAWSQGVDGIYMFNFHHHIGHNLKEAEVVFQELGDPRTLEHKDKLYTEVGCFDCLNKYPRSSDVFQAFVHQLPEALEEGKAKTVEVLVADDLDMARRRGMLQEIKLSLTVVGLTWEDVLELTWNGRPLPENPRLEIPRNRVGPGPIEYQGNYVMSYGLTHGDWIRQGVNRLEATLKKRNPQVRIEMILHSLELSIEYRTLPTRV